MKKFFLRLTRLLHRAASPSPSDPFVNLGLREWADLPVYHPPRDPQER